MLEDGTTVVVVEDVEFFVCVGDTGLKYAWSS